MLHYYMKWKTKLTKDVLLISEILPHVSKLLHGGLLVHVADVSEDAQQGVLHILRHPDFPADIDVSSLTKRRGFSQ